MSVSGSSAVHHIWDYNTNYNCIIVFEAALESLPGESFGVINFTGEHERLQKLTNLTQMALNALEVIYNKGHNVKSVWYLPMSSPLTKSFDY